MKTSELTGAALDWAVAKCEGATDFWFDTVATHWVKLDGKDRALRQGWAQSYLPSTDWSEGGPIIEREGINLFQRKGPTPLIAAMRCYVASKMGDYVEIPEELNAPTI
jgi:hypothetical protein